MENNSVTRQFLSPQELSQYLGLSLNTIYSWVSQKRIPHIKVSRLVKFRVSEIDEWMESMRIEPYNFNREDA